MALTLFDKIWNGHVVSRSSGFLDTLYIDTHFINKVTSQSAFETLRKSNMPIFRTRQTVVINEPEYTSHIPLNDLERSQLDLLARNCRHFGIEISTHAKNYDGSLTALPGQTIVCDPENTDNLGAFGAIAFGVNELEVEQVLASQCLQKRKPKTMKIEVNGKLDKGLSAQDINHYLVAEIANQSAKDYFIEFGGDTILSLDMDGRMAICNISPKLGAVGGIMAPDKRTFDYLIALGLVPEIGVQNSYPKSWNTLFSDEKSVFDEVLEFDAEDIRIGNSGVSILKLANPSSQIAGDTDNDQTLKHNDSVRVFEESNVHKTFNGVNPL